MSRLGLLAAIAATALSGCASYAYRAGAGGDYYYGQPSVEYRYYGAYGWGWDDYYFYGGLGWPALYGYYGYPYHGGGWWQGHPRPSHGHGPRPGGRHDRDDRRPPWRGFDAAGQPRSFEGERPRPQQRPERPPLPAARGEGRSRPAPPPRMQRGDAPRQGGMRHPAPPPRRR